MTRILRLATVGLFAFGATYAGATLASPNLQGADSQILLRSRQFTPNAGIEPIVRAMPSDPASRRHVLLQLRSVPTTEEQTLLAGQGVNLLNYVPNLAWFASIEGPAVTRLDRTPLVRWVGEIRPDDRLAETLAAGKPAAHAVLPDGTLNLHVIYFADVEASDARTVVEKHGGIVVASQPLFHQLVVRAPKGALSALAGEDGLRWIAEVPPKPVAQNDSIRARMRVNDVQASPYNLTGAGVTVGIWDCSNIAAHQDFGTRLTNIFGQVDTGCTNKFHSTHVAGIVAGSGSRSAAFGGVPGQWGGMAPEARILSYDWLTPTEEVVSAVGSPYFMDIANNSWGYPPSEAPCSPYNNLAPAYDQIVYANRVSIVFAAGNQHSAASCGGYGNVIPPGTAKNVMTVGATNSQTDEMTSFSSWGPTDDGRLKPDVVAPGFRPSDGIGPFGCDSGIDGTEGIRSTCPGPSGGGYGKTSGTSMAAPAVTGMYALLLQAYRQLVGVPAASLEPATLKALSIQGAIDLGSIGPDFQFGWGRVDARNSVDLLRSLRFHEDVVGAGSVVTYTRTVAACDAPLKATLVWDDVAGTVNALPALVNNLDLTLKGPTGGVELPWVLNPAQPGSPATRGTDMLNNVEQVLVASPGQGTWTATVSGTLVTSGTQRFSVVMNGLPLPVMTSVSSASVSPGDTITVHGKYFEQGCTAQPLSVAFAGGVTVTLPAGTWTFGTLTVTVPANAESGDFRVVTPAGQSNPLSLKVFRPRAFVPTVFRSYPPPYEWLDASGGAPIIYGEDDNVALPLPFRFTFNGTAYDSVTVNSNGFVSFSPLIDKFFTSQCLPNGNPPNNAIYGFWHDLSPGPTSNPDLQPYARAVWAKLVNELFVIEWQEVPRYGTTDIETFEIVLYRSGGIAIQYQTVNNVLDMTVGTENIDGTAADQRYCHTGSSTVGIPPAPGTSIFFSGN